MFLLEPPVAHGQPITIIDSEIEVAGTRVAASGTVVVDNDLNGGWFSLATRAPSKRSTSVAGRARRTRHHTLLARGFRHEGIRGGTPHATHCHGGGAGAAARQKHGRTYRLLQQNRIPGAFNDGPKTRWYIPDDAADRYFARGEH